MAKAAKSTPDVASVEDELLEEIATEDAAAAPVKKSRFAALAEEALKDYEPAAPYPFDADPEHVVYVSRPDTTERALALASIIDTRGNVDLDRMQPMLFSLLGDAFGPIWDVIKDLPVEVTIALIHDIQEYFFPEISKEDVEKLSGGSADSSS